MPPGMKPEHDYFVSEFMNKNVVEVTLDTPVRRLRRSYGRREG